VVFFILTTRALSPLLSSIVVMTDTLSKTERLTSLGVFINTMTALNITATTGSLLSVMESRKSQQ
jgi:hypothetical protein